MDNFNNVHRTYTKINTLYKRDEKGNIVIGDFSMDVFKYLFENKWLAFEKVDGTNMSWYWDGHEIQIHGKTAKASIPKHLEEKMREVLSEEKLKEVFPPKFDEEGKEIPFLVRIYGEGYGRAIQSCGGRYDSKHANIRVFDIMIDGWWLNWDDVVDICNKLNLNTVISYGEMTLKEAEEMVIKGFKSTISEDKDLNAEGLVLRPLVQLFNRKNERVMVKIKTCDYRKIGK